MTVPAVHFSSLLATCGNPTSYGYLKDCWPQGYTIQLQLAPSGFQTFQSDAANDWNFYLTQDDWAPRFRINPGNTFDDVLAVGTESGTQYCGTFSIPRDTVYIRAYGGTGSCQVNAHTGTWSAAYRQELAGVVGWDESVEQTKDNFQPGMTTMCVLFLDPDQPNGSRFVNPNVCAHDADGVIIAYRGLEGTIGYKRMFKDTLYMHVSLLPAGATIAQGDSVRIAADSFYSGGLGMGGPPALFEVRGHIPVSKSASPSNLSWFSRAPGPVVSRGNGWFVGQTSGDYWVGARAVGSPSASTRWWRPLVDRGDSVHITVNGSPPPPPPPPPYVVTTTQTPITHAGSHLFTSHLGGPSTTIYWQLDDSRTTGTDPDTTFATSGPNVTLLINEGSYTLRFRVSLVPDPQFPEVWNRQDIPVCTEAGQEFRNSGKEGGGSTDAVGGCPPPGDQ